MRSIPKPTDVFQDVFNLCVEGVGDAGLRQRYVDIGQALGADAAAYEVLASQGSLWAIPPNNQGKDEVVVGQVSKSELKKLYSGYMAVQEKPARTVYDRLMSSAPGEMCPYCGVGRVATLDHYLPKAKFPRLAIAVENLVPACRDCNMGGKKTAVATNAESQPIHPYYDAIYFNREQWLFCEVIATVPATVRYYSDPPQAWSETNKQRTGAHLLSFDLISRFSFQAAEELSHIRQIFVTYYRGATPDERRDYLLEKEFAESLLHPNSWKRAMYQALSGSLWYCGGGYQ